ncbi:MAG: hypothetical protein A3F83_11220 [Candidatus Glassbacteria bacterium RIFCSPLOWO2_12_FULL_58_11]|uniref:Uncharacterized protein n=1 Tax=Candidatus Glassbacteria bacterium RIFCSPLOWO2_12_FULL_58_11 TaxID=1817867 RepID=A0A1F5YZE8_9BACT|nr:MAG: hypothetical protein A3F83_11220 [Candidatus Glassbacteria bacterium RIFCSPLOWO2_12_FULL_58_11]
MDRWLNNFAYRINLDFWTFILAGVLALVIAALTVGYQAIKAATANPVDALRYEWQSVEICLGVLSPFE